MSIHCVPLSTEEVRRLQAGGAHIHGQQPEQSLSYGSAIACRY